MSLTTKQREVLAKPLNGSRVAHRSQGGKQLSYLEAFDVRAHLTRVFDYCNWDEEILECYQIGVREYDSKDGKPMAEAMWYARVRLTIRDHKHKYLCSHTEAAVGSTAGPASMVGEHHDNALKTAASDALKRCAMNLGNQFGLSLYDDGSLRDVVKGTVFDPPKTPGADLSPEQAKALQDSLGAEVDGQDPAAAPPAAQSEEVKEGASA